MGDWSSFEKDKSITDEWRNFQLSPVDLDEGLYDTFRGLTGASGSLQKLLSTQSLAQYKQVYIEMLKIWVTAHEDDPRLKYSLDDFIENFDSIIYILQNSRDENGQIPATAETRRALESVADFGDEKQRSRRHLIDLVQTDTSYTPSGHHRYGPTQQKPQDADGDGQPDPPADTDGDGQPDPPQQQQSADMVFRLKPLSQKLKASGLSTQAIVAILKNLKQQLAANNVPVRLQEGLDGILQEFQTEIDEQSAKSKRKAARKIAAKKERERREKAAAQQASADTTQRRKDKKQADKDKRHGRKSQPKQTQPPQQTQQGGDSFYARKAAGQNTSSQPTTRAPAPSRGQIKVSGIHQWLRDVDPSINNSARRQAVKIVRQHLEPYIKHYKLKLKENDLERLSSRVAEELQKLGLLL